MEFRKKQEILQSNCRETSDGMNHWSFPMIFRRFMEECPIKVLEKFPWEYLELFLNAEINQKHLEIVLAEISVYTLRNQV